MNIKNIEKAFNYKDYSNVDWNDIWLYEKNRSKFSITFIDMFKDKIKWEYLFQFKDMSEKAIEKYKDYYSNEAWINICKYQTLSEKFIEKYKDKLGLKNISRFQKLSKEFIKK